MKVAVSCERALETHGKIREAAGMKSTGAEMLSLQTLITGQREVLLLMYAVNY